MEKKVNVSNDDQCVTEIENNNMMMMMKRNPIFLSSSCNSHHHHHIFFLSHESITYHDHKINHTHVFFLNTFFSIMISSSLEKKIDVKVYKMGE